MARYGFGGPGGTPDFIILESFPEFVRMLLDGKTVYCASSTAYTRSVMERCFAVQMFDIFVVIQGTVVEGKRAFKTASHDIQCLSGGRIMFVVLDNYPNIDWDWQCGYSFDGGAIVEGPEALGL